MAILKRLLNSSRLGEDINTYREPTGGFTSTPTTTGGFTEGGISRGDGGRVRTGGSTGSPTGGYDDYGDDGCLGDTYWDEARQRCMPNDKGGGGTVTRTPKCPEGTTQDSRGNCIPDGINPPKWYKCPDGSTVQNPDDCNKMGGKTKPPCVPNWSPSTNTVGIGQSFTQSDGCGKSRQAIGTKEIDPTPPDDPINEPVGGFTDSIEDEGGDQQDFYDRFPIDYDPSRFGDYQLEPTLQGIFSDLGVEVKDKYKDFFSDYQNFPEKLAQTEFDVGRKGLTADLFNLTRGSQRLRQNQGLLSGAPREFERLGMGQVGRQFQGMDTAFRKDIYGMRKGFEEDTVNRLLDLMKSNADPTVSGDDFHEFTSEGFNDFAMGLIGRKEGGVVGVGATQKVIGDFYQWLAGNPDINLNNWQDFDTNTQRGAFRQWYENVYED